MKHATDKTMRGLVTRQRRIEKAIAGNKDATIRLIANDVLGIETLDARKSDGLGHPLQESRGDDGAPSA